MRRWLERLLDPSVVIARKVQTTLIDPARTAHHDRHRVVLATDQRHRRGDPAPGQPAPARRPAPLGLRDAVPRAARRVRVREPPSDRAAAPTAPRRDAGARRGLEHRQRDLGRSARDRPGEHRGHQRRGHAAAHGWRDLVDQRDRLLALVLALRPGRALRTCAAARPVPCVHVPADGEARLRPAGMEARVRRLPLPRVHQRAPRSARPTSCRSSTGRSSPCSCSRWSR